MIRPTPSAPARSLRSSRAFRSPRRAGVVIAALAVAVSLVFATPTVAAGSGTGAQPHRSPSALSSPPLSAPSLSAPAPAPTSTPSPGTEPVEIDIVSINDFHGRLEAADPAAGAATLGGLVDAVEAENADTLFVSAGDNIGASTFTSFIQEDQPTIDVLNEIGLDASALGNHEFDKGVDDLNKRVLPASRWPYLAANVFDAATGEPAFNQFSLSEVGGVTIGFIGAVTTALPSLVSPSGIAGLEIADIPTSVNAVSATLSDGDYDNGEADVIVLLLHEGAASPAIEAATDGSVFGTIVAGVDANVDAIISGHTHQSYNHTIEIPNSGGKTRPVLQSGQYGEQFGQLSLSVDPKTGDLVQIASTVAPLFDAFTPDAGAAGIVAAAVEVANVAGAAQVGRIAADFTRARQGLDGSENRGGESTLGNFVADVQQWATQDTGAQVALMNPGGLRSDLLYSSSAPGDPDGGISYREAASVQPFANTLVTMTLTGQQLKQVLEEQWQPAGSSRPFLKLGVSRSLSYLYDPAAPAGEHIDSLFLNGVALAPTDTVRVVVNSFLASGGDNFTTLAAGTDRADTGRIDLDSMVDYVTANPLSTPDYGQRAVGVSLAPAGPYLPGSTLTLSLSSLLFSSDAPPPATVQVGLVQNGAAVVPLAEASIDPTIVDTTDEGGRATVTVTLPAVLAPDAALSVVVPVSGTSIRIPLEIAAAP